MQVICKRRLLLLLVSVIACVAIPAVHLLAQESLNSATLSGRVVDPDGRIHNIADEGRIAFGAPTRVAFHADPNRSWLYVDDSSKNQLVSVNIPKTSRNPFAIGPRTLPVPVPRSAE